VAFRKNQFQATLTNWYHHNGRVLPWRQTRDPYAILVSEIMLQQTQVAAVIPYYNEWLRRFPDFAAVARASESDILHAWQGLGYYARVRNLQATAKTVQNLHGGRFPRDLAATRALPGIGPYTANAIATFAFDRPVPIVETNTARVLARLFDFRDPIDRAAGRDALWTRASILVPRYSARIYNSALVDLGALVCLPHQPKCGICPVKKFCRAKNPKTLPIKKSRPRTKLLVERHAVVVSNGKILLERSSTRWRGMWILPPLKLDGLKPSSSRRRPVYKLVFPFTHHRVTLRIFHQRPPKIDNRSQRWFSIRRIESVPIPSPHRRAIVGLLSARPATPSRRRRSSGP